MLEYFIEKQFSFVCFDFRANGLSTGKYVTLGWLETVDINRVLKFLLYEQGVDRIALWGRSMGAAAIIFFLS